MKQSNETRSEMEARHENETKELELATSKLLKNAKKSTRAQVEAQIIQMQFDLRAKHREEEDNFESEYNESIDEIIESKKNIAKPVSAAEEIEKKRAKAKAKQEKKLLKEKERLSTIEQSKALLTGPSLREKEIDQIDNKLKPISMKIKDIASDGNCLYRAIADQLQLEYPDRKLDWVQLRMSAARHIRSNREEYAPFIGLSAVMTAEEEIEFEEYCKTGYEMMYLFLLFKELINYHW